MKKKKIIYSGKDLIFTHIFSHNINWGSSHKIFYLAVNEDVSIFEEMLHILYCSVMGQED